MRLTVKKVNEALKDLGYEISAPSYGGGFSIFNTKVYADDFDYDDIPRDPDEYKKFVGLTKTSFDRLGDWSSIDDFIRDFKSWMINPIKG